MNTLKLATAFGLVFVSCAFSPVSSLPDWGFFAHKRINRLAVFTLPSKMYPLFKVNIEYLTEHAVDPDKRRYANPYEAPRHYIDLDVYGSSPPAGWLDALAWQVKIVRHCGKTVDTLIPYRTPLYPGNQDKAGRLLDSARWRLFLAKEVAPFVEGEKLSPDPSTLGHRLGGDSCTLELQDEFIEHGILPWHLYRMQRRLTAAFRQRDRRLILSYAADIGHYIGDAHVPLHTTRNYNGQLTGQEGIHAFWESRIPELFADERFDFLVGKANYIEDPRRFFWQVVEESHGKVDSVLAIERQVSDRIPPDRHFCFEKRNTAMVRTQCRDFADAYDKAMRGMVERRMRKAIRAVGSSWYTAWVDAGRPDLQNLERVGSEPPADTLPPLSGKADSIKIIGRPHE